MHIHWMSYVWILAGLGVLTVLAILLSMSVPQAAPQSQSQSAPLGFPEYAPPPRAADVIAVQNGFSALVSFTDRGFEPANIVIKAGETIRFSNNASVDLQLTSPDSSIFAGAGSVAPRSYVELTFSNAGQFQYSNAQTGATGVIIVQ